MFLSTFSLPYSLAVMLTDTSITIQEDTAFRTDRLSSNVSSELLCNSLSNLSPISAVPGESYLIPSRLFTKYFARS